MQADDVRRSIQAFSQYLRGSTGVGHRTVKAYLADMKSFAEFLDHAAREEEFPEGGALFHAFVAWLRERRKNGSATIRRKMMTLACYFRWRVKSGFSAKSPLDEAEIVVRLPKRLPRALARPEVALLVGGGLSSAKARQPAMDLSLRLLLATGIRIGEMCSIDAVDVVPDGASLRIKGKGDRERTVFVGNAPLRDELAALATVRQDISGPDAALFLNRKNLRLTPQAFRLRLHRLASRCGLRDRITPHRLRHTAATLLLEEGVDIRFVQRLLGHASIATTEIYTKVVDSSLKAALDRADPLRHMQR